MTQPQKSITGVLNALLTPMLDNGSVDFESLTQLIEHQLKHGVHGFYSGGSTAEGFILTTEERMKVLETVVKQVAQRAKVVAHIGAISTDEAIRLAEHAE